MDRDPSENVVDSEDRTTPTTGNSDYGESGAARARKAKRDDRLASDATPGNAKAEEAGRGPGS
jgi:hypothetical protein